MSPRTIGLPEHVAAYVKDHGSAVDPLLQELIDETATLSQGRMQVAPEQGRFLAFLIELMGARRVVEVGTFTGYSSLCMARAVGPTGHVACFDKSDDWTQIAQRYWQKAGVSDRITLQLGPAAENLWKLAGQGLKGERWDGTVDLVFIDADKGGYDLYYDYALDLLRPGGLVALDNILWKGDVADPNVTDKITTTIRAINTKVVNDPRVAPCLVPIGDGLMLARKR